VDIDLPDLAATEELARQLAAGLRAGDAVLLEGPLGAGKTTLARAMLRALCGDPSLVVPSPSYTLVQSYDAPGFTVHHFDLWRLDGPGAVIELGWDEARAGVVLVEWPDRLGALAPADALHVTLTLGHGEARNARIEKGGRADG
jgi:tRNA threonylcarbamoyladenosine biosynthesis protein TsaE